MKDRETLSLCHTCYRHIPADRITRDDGVYLIKTCPEHGHMEECIEKDVEFYNSLVYNRVTTGKNTVDEDHDSNYENCILFEVTDRCNLECPHCYHQPDNKIVDKSFEHIFKMITDQTRPSMDTVFLTGAECTVRKDLPELIKAITDRGNDVCIMTNGVKLSKRTYVKSLVDAGLKMAVLGLNHESYQGKVVHGKQVAGIDICNEEGMCVEKIFYTVEHIDQVADVMEEIQAMGLKNHPRTEYRIRAGSDIGRTPDEPRFFLSDHVKLIKSIADRKGWTWEKIPGDDNLYHYMVKINGLVHRIIQWCDARTIDMEQLKCGPYAYFVPGKPASNFLHQIILRDAHINNGLPLLDTVPDRYIANY